jgi:hypothetical protein
VEVACRAGPAFERVLTGRRAQLRSLRWLRRCPDSVVPIFNRYVVTRLVITGQEAFVVGLNLDAISLRSAGIPGATSPGTPVASGL